MHKSSHSETWIDLDCNQPIWSHFFTVAPLVVIGTKEKEGGYDLAPKHMVTPLGQDNYFGFVCTPRHNTYHNIMREQEFTVSFPLADQIVMASLAATPRNCTPDKKQLVHQLPTIKAHRVDALLLRDSYLFFECVLDRMVDGFGEYSLIAGRILEARVQENAIRISDGDDEEMINKMPLLAYLAYDRFAEIQDTKTFPFPKGFTKLSSESKSGSES